MDDISILLQEARPLYHRRKQFRRTVRYHCAALAVVALFTPIFIHAHHNRIDINTLYADLYSNTVSSGDYYIDEFDAIGII